MSSTDETFAPENPSELWQLLKAHVTSFVRHWQEGRPPEIASFLPTESLALRRLALIEFIKIDLEYRWPRPEWRKPLERYAEECPELYEDGSLPCDLIYEEYRIRKQAGEAVSVEEYCQRFPDQADELRRIMRTASGDVSTQILAGEPATDINVDQRVDDFDLLAKLGQGAFARVFLARQRSLGRMVALKVSADRGHEPQTLAQMDHPNIVRVFDQRLLAKQKLRLLYMQYVPGGTLEEVIDHLRTIAIAQRNGKVLLEAVDRALAARGESIPSDSRSRHDLAQYNWPQVVCWVGARLATALAYAHERGILHRDLKPANVLMAADGNPKLADFNISFSSKVEGATPAAYFGGSLAYMSPEQLEACNPAHDRSPDSLDARSDLFSLGVLLWELLTGERPFADERAVSFSSRNLRTMTVRRQNGPDKSLLAEVPPGCPAGLIEVLETCLKPDVNERYASAAEVARRLELCLSPEVDRLLRPGAKSWATRVRRHPLTLLIVAGVIPNAICSGLNIAYNIQEIVHSLNSEAVADVFRLQLATINPIAYGIGIAVILRLAWPALKALWNPNSFCSEPGEVRELARVRSLKLGEYVAWMSAAEWFVSGLVFPLWLHLELGDASGMQTHHYVHFLVSQFLCGTMAATLAFFAVTLLSTRAFCPALVDVCSDEPALTRQLNRLAQRVPIYLYITYLVVPLALMTFVVVETTSRFAFLVLGVVGLLASLLAIVLSRAIQRDVAALRVVSGA
jgi:serine/threonine protein kinase